jgi:hypothetical protein
MPNRQVVPASLFPLRGDVSAEYGATSVRVTGIQGVPVVINGSMGSPNVPAGPYALVYISGIGWTPVPLDCSILCDGVPVSDDYDIAVNLPLGPASTPVKVNGSLV